MNRGGAKKNETRDEINSKASESFDEIEHSSVVPKLISQQPYTKDDMVKSAAQILPKASFDFDKHFKIFENIKDFEPVSDPEVQTSFYVCSKPRPNRWVVFCLVKNEKGDKILYKDSSGKKLPQKFDEVFKKKLGDVEVVVNKKKAHHGKEDRFYGPCCLRNLKIFLERVKKDLQKFVDEFLHVVFSSTEDLTKAKLKNIIDETMTLSKNEEFKSELKKFFDGLPIELVTNDALKAYNKILEEEMKKEEPDYERIGEARKKAYDEKYIEDVKNKCQVSKSSEEGDYLVEIEKNFPGEMLKFKHIFAELGDIKVDEQFTSALKNISERLGINYDKLKEYYGTRSEEETHVEEELAPLDLNDILNSLPEQKNIDSGTCTPFEKLLEEMTLGKDPEDSTQPITPETKQAKEDLQTQYYLLKVKMASWKKKSLREINQWARKIKGRLGSTDEDICEALAVMDQAFCLLTGGFHLRDTQILAVLIFMKGGKEMGRLCQIQTGEGKTNIVSFIAVIKALQGERVDVITSNAVLAEDGVKETQKFYSIFNLTVSTNNPPEDGKEKLGYTADVLYGTISNFQFDYLRDTFEGFDIRKGRKFGQVVLDEVDSMLVDNGGHIAKLAAPFPGMECLRYIYIKIWQELSNAEAKYIEDCKKQLEEILKDPDEETRDLKYEKFVLVTTHEEKKVLKEMVLKSNPIDVPFIPHHLKDYVQCKLPIWVDKALYAKYNCHEHQQYRVLEVDTGEKIIAPVDYLNTGVTMRNTIWSDGLHQFVQLKHNLYLTFESLTSSFVSNIGYIKNYKSFNICGLTGTLGSRAEQELLSGIYKVDYAKLPTYTEKKFEELEGIVVNDDSWDSKITLDVLRKIDERRAVLVICETEQDLMTVEENLKILKSDSFRIRKYANEDYAEETQEKVKIGDVILATNIAGRGTNFKTEKELEEKGGLHVCVGFLPCNLRVEGQAFGRTSRQGNKGTAQLIIRKTEVEELNINEFKDFAEVKKARDDLEKKRLENIKEELVPELDFKDQLFESFSKFYRKMNEKNDDVENMYLMNDLKEFWAFWLEKKNFTAGNIKNVSPEDAFASFKQEAKTITAGKINHNPFYAISLAEQFLELEETKKAWEQLQTALAIAKGDLGGAHIKLFEVAVLNGHQTRERVKEAVAEIFFVNVEKNEEYKQNAVEHLHKAADAISKEISYFNSKIINIESGECNGNFAKILVIEEGKENYLLKHLSSRICALRTQQCNISSLEEDFQKMKEGIEIGGKAPMNIDTLKRVNPDVERSMTSWELSELQSIGLDALYCLKEVKDVPDEIIHTAQGEIGAGITLLVVGLCFPPIFPVVSGHAADLISGAIIDLVMAVISRNDDFNKKEFFKAKFLQHGKALITLGISAVTQCASILTKAINFCRKMSEFLKSAKHLQKICKLLAKLVDKLTEYLENLLRVAEKAASVAKKTRGQLFLDFMQDVSMDVLKSAKDWPIIQEKIIEPMKAETYGKLIEQIEKLVEKELEKALKENSSLVGKLRTSDPEDVHDTVRNFIKMGKIKQLVKKFSPKLIDKLERKLGETKTKLLEIGVDAAIETSELVRCLKDLTRDLNEELKGGNFQNNTDEVIEDVCEVVASEVVDILKTLFMDGVDAFKVEYESIKGDDPFAILGLDPKSSIDMVEDKYRELKLKMHSKMKNSGDKFDPSEYEDINAAYKRIKEEADAKTSAE